MNDMENQQPAYDPLDELLAQPALLADRGFSARIGKEIHKPARRRTLVFAAMAACWASTVLMFTSLQSFMLTMGKLGTLFDSAEFTVVPVQFSEEIGTLGELVARSSLTSIILLGLAVCAGLVLFIREQS